MERQRMSGLIFHCRYCPDTFRQFKVLVRHYETRHNQEGEQYEKFRDLSFYNKNDSGCHTATSYLGHHSSCLKCPFRKCVYDEVGVGPVTILKRQRNEEILKRQAEGLSTEGLADEFDVSTRTIQRILVGK